MKFLNGKMYPWAFRETAANVSSFDTVAKLFISDPEMILEAALLHMGIARMGRHHAWAALQSGELVEVLSDSHVPTDASMALFYPHHAGVAPRVRVLIDYLMAWFAQQESLQSNRPAPRPAPRPPEARAQ